MSLAATTTPLTPGAATMARDESAAVGSADRIGALDILRGIALLGMFLVHFNDSAIGSDTAAGLGATYQKIVALFFEERFWTMFGILFGVGFVVQLRRAEVRGAAFAGVYLRRLAALGGFGLFAHAVFGFNVLLGYAVWGAPLLLVRRSSLRMLTTALVLSAASGSLFSIARASYRVASVGAQPFSFLPVNTFTLFLIGLIGFRLGLFDAPVRHQRVILALMAFGGASWAAEGLFPAREGQLGSPLVRELVLNQLRQGFAIVRGTWLAFVYIGTVLLLVARSPRWLRTLAPFGWSGRMALTTYMVQIAILDLTFSNYFLHLGPAPLQALGAGLALFAVSSALSHWWLVRFRFGPLEWLWRSITYGRFQPWRVASATRVLPV